MKPVTSNPEDANTKIPSVVEKVLRHRRNWLSIARTASLVNRSDEYVEFIEHLYRTHPSAFTESALCRAIFETMTTHFDNYVENLDVWKNSTVYGGSVVKVNTLDELKKIVRECAVDADLNHLDTSAIDNMSWLFANTEFNGKIDKWDVSNVHSMHGTFANSKFNGDISKWDVTNVSTMIEMFDNAAFEGDISEWKPRNATLTSDVLFAILRHHNKVAVKTSDDSYTKTNAYDFAWFALSCLIGYDGKGDIVYSPMAHVCKTTSCSEEYYDRIVGIYKALIVGEDGFDESDPMCLAVRDFQYEKAARAISNPTIDDSAVTTIRRENCITTDPLLPVASLFENTNPLPNPPVRTPNTILKY